jgi:hypothetical protein
MYRTSRAVFSLARRSYVTIPKHSDSFRIQRVQFVRPPPSRPRKLLNTFFGTFTCLLLWRLAEDLFEDETKPKDVKEVKETIEKVQQVSQGEKLGAGIESNAEDDVLDIPDDVWFIPCSWPRLQPKVYYKASDPEWALYRDFNKNPQKGSDAKSTYLSRGLEKRLNNT